MINGFKQYLIEEENVVYFTFGRMNPPTIGHGKLLDKLASTAGKSPYRIFLSQSQDPKKNPLSYSDKIKNVRKMFPKHARSVMINKNVKSAMDILSVLYNQGFSKVVMVVGADRVSEFDILLNKYNGQEARHGFYNFKDIKVVSAGERDPDAEGVEGMSASKMRGFASDNNFTSFTQGLPKELSNADARKLFNDVRKGMGLKEEKNFKNHIQLPTVSDIRESYVDGKLFGIGDQVVIKENGEIGTVKKLGSNYVIIESKANEYRKWLDAVEKIEQPKIEYEVAPYSVKRLDEKFTAQQKHRLDPNLSLKHQAKHGSKIYVDNDGDGDVDAADKMKQAKDFGDVGGVPDLTKYLKKRQDIEKKHSKIGVAFEKTEQPEWGTPESTKKAKRMTPGETNEANPCWPGYKQIGTKLKNGKMVPNCVQEKIDVAQDKDIDDRKGSQPATFQIGIKSKSTKAARDAHFRKMAKRTDHGNPDLYKDAPGDKAARAKGTKPSQYTLKYKRMFGEAQDPVEIANQGIKREKEALMKKHDQIMDRARLLKAKQQNKEVK